MTSFADETAEQLACLLRETTTAASRREAEAFDRLAGSSCAGVVLFGAGLLGRKVLACLRGAGVEPLAFADNDPHKWGTRLEGLEVLSPQRASERFRAGVAFIVTIWSPGHIFQRTREQLLGLGCDRVIAVLPLLWAFADSLLPHYCFDLPHRTLQHAEEIRMAFDLMHDAESRRQYVAHLGLRLRADYDGLPAPSPDDRYFPADLVRLSENEVFVDAGAYDGDTVRALLQRPGPSFRRIWAIEPDPLSAARLREYVAGLGPEQGARITICEVAVGARPGRARFQVSGLTGAALDPAGGHEVDLRPLDSILAGETPTFLKLDVEGAEYDALLGARDVICRARPVIAACVYHRPEDLWRIPLRLHSLGVGYRFALRSHGEDGLETVVYATPVSEHPESSEQPLPGW